MCLFGTSFAAGGLARLGKGAVTRLDNPFTASHELIHVLGLSHSSCDHGVSTRLLPMGINRTAVRVTWLVHEDAVEGRDYQLEEIMPFWQMTSEQDWELCTAAQKGVSSSHYVPGPFSTHKEYNVDAFVTWCLKHLKA